MGSLPYSFFVSYTTQQSDIVNSINRLNPIVICKPKNTLERFLQFYNVDSVIATYGINSEQKKFAEKYFSFQNKNGKYPNLINFYNYYDTAQNATLTGATIYDINTIKVKGSFRVNIDSQDKEVSVDLTNYVSLTDIAKAIQDKIQELGTAGVDNNPPENISFKNATFTFNQITNSFELKSGTAGQTSNIDYITSGSIDIDLAPLLKMRDVDGATIVNGRDIETFQDVLFNIKNNNGNYYAITTLFTLNDDEKLELSNIVHNSKGRFVGIIDMQDKRIIATDSFLSQYKSYNGMIFNLSSTESAYLNSLTSAFIASLDLSNNNSMVSMNFIESDVYDSNDTVFDETSLNNVNANRANCIFAVGDFGERKVFYGEGNIMGSDYSKASIYIANSFMKVNIEKSMFFQIANSQIIGSRNPRDINLLRDVAINQCNNFVEAGIIVANPTLNDSEITSLKQTLNSIATENNSVDDLYNSIMNNGYVFIFSNNTLDGDKVISEFKFCYISNTPTDRIIITSIYI